MSIKIGLDCGHGLKTPGKQTPDGIKEWTLNDKVRDKVVKILSAYECEIIHTDGNEGQKDESLADRVARYKKEGVKAFVSIHHNAYTGKWNNATGVEVYTDKNPTSKDKALANAIYTRLVKNTGLKGRGVKQYDFWVINQDTIPAVLVEGGFMDSKKDYKIITSDEGQTAYAKAVAEGLIEFLKLKKKAVKPQTPSTLYTVQVGAFAKKENAEAYVKTLKKKGITGYVVKK
jgi:N-acetylmuramoyl-L-alanine amidase